MGTMPLGHIRNLSSQIGPVHPLLSGGPRLFLPPKALLTAIAIADDPPGQLLTRIESIVAANENQGNHCFVSLLRWLRVASELPRAAQRQGHSLRKRHGPPGETIRLFFEPWRPRSGFVDQAQRVENVDGSLLLVFAKVV